MALVAYIVYFPLWTLATLGAYGGLIIALFTRYRTDMDRNELPGVLRGSSRLGLAALMFTLVMMCFEIAEHAPLDIPFDPASLEYMTLWSRVIAISASMLSVFAVITVIPTGWCLIWEARLRRKHQSTAPRDS